MQFFFHNFTNCSFLRGNKMTEYGVSSWKPLTYNQAEYRTANLEGAFTTLMQTQYKSYVV